MPEDPTACSQGAAWTYLWQSNVSVSSGAQSCVISDRRRGWSGRWGRAEDVLSHVGVRSRSKAGPGLEVCGSRERGRRDDKGVTTEERRAEGRKNLRVGAEETSQSASIKRAVEAGEGRGVVADDGSKRRRLLGTWEVGAGDDDADYGPGSRWRLRARARSCLGRCCPASLSGTQKSCPSGVVPYLSDSNPWSGSFAKWCWWWCSSQLDEGGDSG